MAEQTKDVQKQRTSGYCPTCDCIRELKIYEQVFDAKYNLPAKTYADCTHCGNTFRYLAVKENQS